MAKYSTTSSPYESLVMTQGHPAKVEYRNVEPGEYLGQSGLGSFLAARREEVLILVFMAIVAVYCTG